MLVCGSFHDILVVLYLGQFPFHLPHALLTVPEADLVCRQCLTEGSNFFRKWKTLSEFSDLFGIAILLSVHVSYVASLCVSLYTYGLHW